MCGFARRRNLVRGVEQGLGGNAATVQTNPTQPLVALDERDFLAEVGRIKSRGVTTWPGANDYNLSFDRIHES
jgi:hypothetical protein